MSVKFIAGALLAACGAALACMGGTTDMRFPLCGTLAAFGAMVCWCGYAVGSDYLAKRGYSPVHIVRGAFFWAVALSSLIVILKSVLTEECIGPDCAWSFLARFDGISLANLAFLGFVASALCYVVWEWIGMNGGYGRAVVMLYLSPISTVIISMIAFCRLAPWEEWLGALLSIVGVFIGMTAKKRNTTKSPQK